MRAAPAPLAVLLAALLSLSACGPSAPSPAQYLTDPELMALVHGNTLRMRAGDDPPLELMLYLAPDGTGWFDSSVVAGGAPQPSDMEMVFAWGVATDSHVCAWVTPRIGEMPAFTPSHQECVQVVRAKKPPYGLTGIATPAEAGLQGPPIFGSDTVEAPLVLDRGNAFPQAQIEGWVEQVRALYGGRLPSWGTPAGTGLAPLP